jgi:hypothetical protein
MTPIHSSPKLCSTLFTGLVGLALLSAGCGAGSVVDALQPPVIADATPAPQAAGDVTLLAEVTEGGAYETTVFLRYARHFWPGAADAHDGSAVPVDGEPGRFRFNPPGVSAFRQGDVVFYQWFVEYKLPDGNDVAVVESPVERLVVGCTPGQEEVQLITDQASLVSQFGTLDLPSGPAGYAPVPTHGFVSLTNTGIAYARLGGAYSYLIEQAGEIGGLTAPADPVLGQPDLLFYAPRAQDPDESSAEYLTAITDQLPDPPYSLAGWAYGRVYDGIPGPPARRPSLGCIPSDAWFIHEAGYHLPDGNMALTPPNEDVPGAVPVGVNAFPVPPTDAGVWHPRIWDLHLWVNDTNTPDVAIFSPTPIAGLSGLPAGIFFQPETFE